MRNLKAMGVTVKNLATGAQVMTEAKKLRAECPEESQAQAAPKPKSAGPKPASAGAQRGGRGGSAGGRGGQRGGSARGGRGRGGRN